MSTSLVLILQGYRQEMVTSIIFSSSILILCGLLFYKKKLINSNWLTLITCLLILAELSVILCSVFWYTQFNLLWQGFPLEPPTSADINTSKKLLTAYDAFTEIYYFAVTNVYVVLLGLLWQASSRIEQLSLLGCNLLGGLKYRQHHQVMLGVLQILGLGLPILRYCLVDQYKAANSAYWITIILINVTQFIAFLLVGVSLHTFVKVSEERGLETKNKLYYLLAYGFFIIG